MPLTGDGYFAGEYPDGTTTVEGAPVSATVLVYQRDSGQLVAQTESSQSGEWIVTGVDLSKAHDIVGRKEGFNDVIVSNVMPTSMVDITYAGAVVENETFTGAEGYVEVIGGIPPYSVTVETPFPPGLFPIIDGHKLIIDGTTGADEVASFDVKVTSSNGAEKIIPLQLVVGFKAPQNFKAETVVVNDVFSVVLTWETTNSTQQVKVYRSETPIDMDDLPEPIATLSGTSTTYTDDDVIEDDVFYYMTASVCESYTLYSDGGRKVVVGGDPHWDKVVSLLHFDDDLTDETGRTWQKIGDSSFGSGVFGSGLLLPRPNSGSNGLDSDGVVLDSDFTIEFFINSNHTADEQCIVSCYKGSGSKGYTWEIVLGKTNGNLRFYHHSGSRGSYILDSSINAADGVSRHVAVTRGGSMMMLFVDGNLHDSIVEFKEYTAEAPLSIGYQHGGNGRFPLKGMVDEFRITKGVARYTDNFTPPTKPFPNK